MNGLGLVGLACFRLLKGKRNGWFGLNHAKVFIALAGNSCMGIGAIASATGLGRNESLPALRDLVSAGLVQRECTYAVGNPLEALSRLIG